jgi:histidinol phosphatase-like enzyme
LIEQAARELSLDLAGSILVGDMYSDLMAGQAAGVPRLALVRTGLGASQLDDAPGDLLGPFEVFENLSEALGALIVGFPRVTEEHT